MQTFYEETHFLQIKINCFKFDSNVFLEYS